MKFKCISTSRSSLHTWARQPLRHYTNHVFDLGILSVRIWSCLSMPSDDILKWPGADQLVDVRSFQRMTSFYNRHSRSGWYVVESLRWKRRFHPSAGLQSSEHNNHQLLRPFSEGGLHRRPGDDKTCGGVWLCLQQRPSSSHIQQHGICLLPKPLPGAPQSLRCSGAKTWRSHHSQSKSEKLWVIKDLQNFVFNGIVKQLIWHTTYFKKGTQHRVSWRS